MGRQLKPIEDSGPIGQFAQKLRDRKAQMPGRTFRRMGEIAACSHALLAEACNGKKFPTWAATVCFLEGLEARAEEIKHWHEEWTRTERLLIAQLRVAGEIMVTVPVKSHTGQSNRPGKLRPIQPDIAGPDDWQPNPERVHTFEDLRTELVRFRLAVGNPPLRDLAKSMYCSVTTLSDVFTGKRTPGLELLLTMIRGFTRRLRQLTELQYIWTTEAWWQVAWTRAEYNRERPDLLHRRRVGNIMLMTDDQNEGPSSAILASMPTDAAAAMLASLNPDLAGRILTGMPTKKAQAIINAMEALHRIDEPGSPQSVGKRQRPTAI